MNKLLAAFQASQTEANRAKLAKHIAKHPFSVCICTVEELAFLMAHGVIA